ncbi:cell division protein FtsA [Geovibrio thiophilus]|uniref:Cell division protein FtsA n=1 Tax=Geovibrio thiophilus TaxID=139438 RepID=A0A3R5XY50_9BACT|nr:cell division protein FtsA [Geovibrio thiophilus]QAR34089.1 cell division protein FtsA [Geovibrio thiophilus]
MSQDNNNIYVGLDLGTTKVCIVVARKNADRSIDILGIGSVPSKGVRKGVVVNIEETVACIQKAKEEAERMSGMEIKSVTAGLASGHIKSFNTRGTIAVKSREVTQQDVDRVIESASAYNMQLGEEILDVIPQQYILDGQTEIKYPVGMSGVRLEVDVHIVTGQVSSATNIVKCCEKAGLVVDDIILEQFASAKAVLSEDEMEIGVCLIDGGGGTCDMAVYKQGAVYHTAILQIGGNHFTKDLSIGLSTPESEAERLKIKHGCVWMPLVSDDEMVNVTTVGGRPPRKISKPVLTQILQARGEEIFQMFKGELQKHKLLELMGAGIVVTGGLSNFEGIEELATSVFNTPVRVGRPINIGGLTDLVSDPRYATAVGLAIYATRKGKAGAKLSRGSEDKVFGSIFQRMKGWLKEFF